MDQISNLFAGVYSAKAGANILCYINGQMVPCEKEILGFLGFISFAPVLFLIIFIASIFVIAGVWKMFVKAGKPGWASLIPIYNMVMILEITKKPIWWIFFYFIPVINIIIGLVVVYELSKSFGKGIGFTLGMIFLPFIFYPILGFGKSEYRHQTK